MRNLELASQQESGSFDLWRLMAAGYSKLNNPGMTSLARAEMAILRGQRAEAQAHAAAAERQLQAGTPAWQRAQDIKAYINSRPAKRRYFGRSDHAFDPSHPLRRPGGRRRGRRRRHDHAACAPCPRIGRRSRPTRQASARASATT